MQLRKDPLEAEEVAEGECEECEEEELMLLPLKRLISFAILIPLP